HLHPARVEAVERDGAMGAARARAQVLLRRGVRRGVRPHDGRPGARRPALHRGACDRRSRGGHRRAGRGRRAQPRPHPDRLLPQLRAGVRRGRRRGRSARARAGELMTLTSNWLVPLFGAILIAFMPPRFAKWMGVLVALVTLGISGGVALAFAPNFHGYQFTEQVPWIPQLHIFYHLGMDGISVWLVVLNALLTVIAVLATPVEKPGANRFIALLLAMSAGMAGVFLAVDLVLFYVFWEAMLIPTYFLLWLFGEGEKPGAAAIKFVLYTLAGSLLMLVGVIGEYVFTGPQPFDL